MRLDTYSSAGFTRGRPAWLELAWMLVQALLLSSWLPGSRHRVWLLRLFGAKVGVGVVIKPGVRIKFPWRLRIGDHSWIGERVWIDNLAPVDIGAHTCISQGAYLLTGNHDWASPGFDLMVQPITIGDQCWVCAKAVVIPGARLLEGSIIGTGSVIGGVTEPWTIYRGNPAIAVKARPRKSSAAP